MSPRLGTYRTLDTPDGPFTVIVDADGVVLASGWTTSLDDLILLIHPSIRPVQLNEGDVGPAADAVAAYYDGDLTALDGVAVLQRSGEFLEHAWDVLRQVPAGTPLTYTAYAAKAGRPGAVRPAAAACGRNAAALFVPCHRVVRSDGTLGGFRWGLDVKRSLLARESA